jgi:hypothetical protein
MRTDVRRQVTFGVRAVRTRESRRSRPLCRARACVTMCMCVCVCVCICARARACVHAFMYACLYAHTNMICKKY